MKDKKYFYGTGRRKTSVARVRVYNTPGESTINDKPMNDFFTVDSWKKIAILPLKITTFPVPDSILCTFALTKRG